MFLWLIRKGIHCYTSLFLSFSSSLEGKCFVWSAQVHCATILSLSLSLSPFDVNFTEACGPLIVRFPAIRFDKGKRGMEENEIKIEMLEKVIMYSSFDGLLYFLFLFFFPSFVIVLKASSLVFFCVFLPEKKGLRIV
jgi:hypothetical protein